jgi:hypothetical protein
MSPFPTSQDFQHLLLTAPSIDAVMYKYVLEGVPFAFRDSEAGYERLRQHISSILEVPPRDLAIVGSGRIGFSLDPEEFGRVFSDSSDLDVVVVSDSLFDMAWMELLRPKYRDYELTNQEREWVKAHKRYVYWGNIRPDLLPSASTISRKWLEAFRGLSIYPEFAARDIHGWLYRSWWHVHLYHRQSLQKLADELRVHEKGPYKESGDETRPY